MSRARLEFKPEFKAEVVGLVLEGGRPLAQVCRDLDLTESAVRHWVVGWSMSEHPDTDLTLAALEMACHQRQGTTALLCHSDRGCQYTSLRYRQYLETQGLHASMSRVGNCWDNAVAESFFATLKVGLVQVSRFATRVQARQAIFEYIEVFYNRQRSHSSLGYLCPLAFERSYYRQSAHTA